MRHTLILSCLALLFFAGCTAAGVSPSPALVAAEPEPLVIAVSDREYMELARVLQDRADQKLARAPASSRYTRRLTRVMAPHRNEDGAEYSFAVYMTRRVLAEAMPNGEIRISAGFLSMLTDNELRFIMAHLMGEIRNGAVLAALRSEFVRLDLKKPPSALTAAEQDKLLVALAGHHYTPEQEERADDYAFAFMKKYGYDLRSIISVLHKVDRLEKGIVFTSSHADSTVRARRLHDRLAAEIR